MLLNSRLLQGCLVYYPAFNPERPFPEPFLDRAFLGHCFIFGGAVPPLTRAPGGHWHRVLISLLITGINDGDICNDAPNDVVDRPGPGDGGNYP